MKTQAKKLITVKSILTMIMSIVFAVLTLRGTISGTEFLTIFTMIVSFYFGTQHEKSGGDENGTSVSD